MIDLLIFSMDRAAQLDLLLRSIEKNADIFNISVLCNYSNDEFREGYHKLIDIANVDYWILEDKERKSFDSYVKWWLDIGQTDYVAFSTDDTVLYRKIDLNALGEVLPRFNNQILSLRLGYNTLNQDIHRGLKQPPLNQHVNHGGWLSWNINCYNPHDNYGYPFGLDLHVFRRDLIQQIIQNMEFSSTNQLESQLTTNHRHKIDEMRCFEKSCAVNIPVNSINNTTITGQFNPISKEELNQRFLNGEVIDLEDIEKQDITGCHQEIQYRFKND